MFEKSEIFVSKKSPKVAIETMQKAVSPKANTFNASTSQINSKHSIDLKQTIQDYTNNVDNSVNDFGLKEIISNSPYQIERDDHGLDLDDFMIPVPFNF